MEAVKQRLSEIFRLEDPVDLLRPVVKRRVAAAQSAAAGRGRSRIVATASGEAVTVRVSGDGSAVSAALKELK